MADDEARARRTTRATAGGAKKAPVEKAATPPARKAAAKTAAAKKAAPVAKAPRVQKAAKKAAPAAKAASARKAAAKKAAPAAKKAAPAKRAAPRKAPARKAGPTGQGRGAVLAPRPRKAPSLRLAAEQTMEDEWEPPAPEPPREDPHARIRSLLRDAALQIEGKAPAPPAPAEPAPEPSARTTAGEGDEVTRVLVAPAPPEEDEWRADEEVEEDPELVAEDVDGGWDDDDVPEDDEEDDWSPPEVLEEDDQEGELLTVASAPSPRLSGTPSPAPPAQAYIPPPAPPSLADPAPTTEFTPPPFEAEPAAAPGKKAGAGRSVLAILLSLILPVIGAVIGFFLARRARSEGAALSGVARAVSVLLLVAWLAVAGVVAYNTFIDEGIDYSQLKVGDCFDSSTSNEIRGIKVKPCSEPHNSEIFFIVTHPGGPAEPYPGKDALVQYAADNCLGQPLTDYLGIPLEQSQLKDFEIVPQESAWKDGRRVLVCGLDTGGEGKITGSVRGTRR